MGVYLKPEKVSNEEYLADKGVRLNKEPKWDKIPKGQVAICLIDNIIRKVAGIAYDGFEFARFSSLDNGQEKTWYLLSKKDVAAASVLTVKDIKNHGEA
jgi:hypothetical protein